MTKKITNLFPLWAIFFSFFVASFPQFFLPLKGWIIPLLGIVMLGMGPTL
jgi:bile acid:Na+ symporter, BASS family